MVALRSSSITSADYDPEMEALTLTFANGRSYTYDGVPQEVFERLVVDPSPGRFYHTYIRDLY
jgi:hypothetical protein